MLLCRPPLLTCSLRLLSTAHVPLRSRYHNTCHITQKATQVHRQLRELAAQAWEPTVGIPGAHIAVGMETLKAREDYYGGVIVDAEALPVNVSEFVAQLQASLQEWTASEKRGIWLKVPIARAGLIAPAIEFGKFVFHHAEEGYVMLTRWLPESSNTLPANCSHQVGVGAFVVNEHQEVLVVQERSGPLRGKGVWKMPTGLVAAGEDIIEAATREVLEETGIRCTFRSVLAIRQAHGFAFDKSDMFFVCALHPEPGQTELTPQESEIVAAKWMPLAEYKSNPFMLGVELYDKMRERCMAYAEGRYTGFTGGGMISGTSKQRIDLLLCGSDNTDQQPLQATEGSKL